jgi:hypothetical protein
LLREQSREAREVYLRTHHCEEPQGAFRAPV